MRSLKTMLAVCAALFLAGINQGPAFAKGNEPAFPPPGTPYLQARASLLKQGLTVARDRVQHADPHFSELDCRPDLVARRVPAACRALFIFKTSNGWGQYVVVEADATKHFLTSAHFAFPMDGLLSIPPPETADVPKVGLDYLQARNRLQRLGFRPIAQKTNAADKCADSKCKYHLHLSEAQCFMDIPVCNAYWAAPNGRFIWIMTVGEIGGGSIYYEKWVSSAEVRDHVR